MGLQLVTPPALEPVVLADAKNHLRVDVTDDDTLITLLISAARRYAEAYCERSFITQTWKLTLDSFPTGDMAVPFGVPYSLPDSALLLERGAVQSITSIQYTAMDGTTQTMPPANYAADFSGDLARVTPAFGQIWPIPLPQIGAVQVTYVAGYGAAAASVPEGIRQWIMMRTNTLYENREEVAILNRGKVEALPFIDGLLDPYRIVRF